MQPVLETTALTCLSLLAYHHVVYPAAMSALGRSRKAKSNPPAVKEDTALPAVHVVIPACNEEAHIYDKIAALAACSYPAEKLAISVICDGCSDGTAAEAKRAGARFRNLRLTIHEHPDNRGKVARLNQYLPRITEPVTVLTDTSAVPAADALLRLARHFNNPAVGAVGGGYALPDGTTEGQRGYWSVQTRIKRGESRLGGLVGAHGAFYAIRSALFEPLPDDSINDDFIIPMRIALAGHQTLYDPDIRVYEAERDQLGTDMQRRRRIGAGNLQQMLRLLPALVLSFNPGLWLTVLSGKFLRVFMGPCLVLLSVMILLLAPQCQIWATVAMTGGLGLTLAFLPPALLPRKLGRIGALGRYALQGHWHSMAGAVRYLSGRDRGWRKQVPAPQASVPPVAYRFKRGVDILGGFVGLMLSLPLFPLIALLIKLESPGPVLFRQMRIGRALPDRTEVFFMYKFRSMRQDAEKHSGPAWARKNDPRVTLVGRFLRKTRLDELPQFYNVLMGEMSLVGPRPERPGFYQTLETDIPFFAERTYWLRPGITGLAQTVQGYAESVEESRTKVMYDHAYALKTRRLSDWLRTDFDILFRTVSVVAFGRGR